MDIPTAFQLTVNVATSVNFCLAEKSKEQDLESL